MAATIVQGGSTTSIASPDPIGKKKRKVRLYYVKDGRVTVSESEEEPPFAVYFFRVYGKRFVDVFGHVNDSLDTETMFACPFVPKVVGDTLVITTEDEDIRHWSIWYAHGTWDVMETDTDEV